MRYNACLSASLCLFFTMSAAAQVLRIPGAGASGGSIQNMGTAALDTLQAGIIDQNLWLINGQNRSPLQTPNGSLSKLDLKAPGKARREYEKGYQLLMKKDYQGAAEHLTTATSIYPSFVAAHNSLGNAYLSLKQNDQARAEFAQAVALD